MGSQADVGGVFGGEEEEYGDRISWQFERDDNPIYHVDEYGVRPEGFGEDYAKSIKDYKLKLGEIWTKDFMNNASLGESPNDEIGIIYEYDFGGRIVFTIASQSADIEADSWTVHISCDPKELFFESGTPINIPIVKKAQGAVRGSMSLLLIVLITSIAQQPPIEHAPDFIPGVNFLLDRLKDLGPTWQKLRKKMLTIRRSLTAFSYRQTSSSIARAS
jgi:hypothetical protein